MEAFNTLSDYHKRRSYDEYLESQIAPMNFFGKNMLSRNLFNDMKTSFDNFDKFPNNGNFQNLIHQQFKMYLMTRKYYL